MPAVIPDKIANLFPQRDRGLTQSGRMLLLNLYPRPGQYRGQFGEYSLLPGDQVGFLI